VYLPPQSVARMLSNALESTLDAALALRPMHLSSISALMHPLVARSHCMRDELK